MRKTRKSAMEALESKYFTGKPCKYGHISERQTIDGSCIECRREQMQGERNEFKRRLKAVR